MNNALKILQYFTLYRRKVTVEKNALAYFCYEHALVWWKHAVHKLWRLEVVNNSSENQGDHVEDRECHKFIDTL